MTSKVKKKNNVKIQPPEKLIAGLKRAVGTLYNTEHRRAAQRPSDDTTNLELDDL